MKALGATIHRTPTEVPSNHPQSHLTLASNLKDQLKPNSYIPDQYSNVNNPLAHYYGTAEEIWSQCGGKIDVVVVGAGTGGTITGLGKRLKELNPNIKIIGVDPYGSILGGEDSFRDKPYQVEGIGYDFIPPVLDTQIVDRWYKSLDKDSFLMARRLIRQEGILCGGSSGAAMSIAIQVAKDYQLGKAQRLLVILPDSVRNYMSKFLDDDWMLIHGFLDPSSVKLQSEFNNDLVSAMMGNLKKEILIVDKDTLISDIIIKEDNDIYAVKSDDQKIIGILNMNEVASKCLRSSKDQIMKQTAMRHCEKQVGIINPSTLIRDAAVLASTNRPLLLVTEDFKVYSLTSSDFLSLQL